MTDQQMERVFEAIRSEMKSNGFKHTTKYFTIRNSEDKDSEVVITIKRQRRKTADKKSN